MLGSLGACVHVYRSQKEEWALLMKNGMTQDLSWNHAAEQYEQLFSWAMMDPPVRHY